MPEPTLPPPSRVGWTHKQVSPDTMTADTNIYASGDLIGGKLTFTNALLRSGGTGTLKTLVLVDQAKQAAAVDLILFNADPDGTTFTDNVALDIADADMAKIVGAVSIPAANYFAFSDNNVAVVKDIGLVVKAASGSSTLYGALVSRGTPTYAAATDLALKLVFSVE